MRCRVSRDAAESGCGFKNFRGTDAGGKKFMAGKRIASESRRKRTREVNKESPSPGSPKREVNKESPSPGAPGAQ
jgi:hypothetical protein